MFLCVSFSAVLFGQFVVFQTLNTDVVEIYDGASTDSALLSSLYGSHSGEYVTVKLFSPVSYFIHAPGSKALVLLSDTELCTVGKIAHPSLS